MTVRSTLGENGKVIIFGSYIWRISRRKPHFRPLGIIMSRYIIRGGVMYGRWVFFISLGETVLFVIEIGFFVVVPSCRLATASIDIGDHLSPRYATRCLSSGKDSAEIIVFFGNDACLDILISCETSRVTLKVARSYFVCIARLLLFHTLFVNCSYDRCKREFREYERQ